MMPVIVINLARAQERRARLAPELAARGVTAEWLAATDGATDVTDSDRNRVDHIRRRAISPYPLSDNEIACYLSHCRAMRRLLAEGWPMAAILEDDAEPLPGFVEALTAIHAAGFGFDVIDLHRINKRGEIFLPLQSLAPRVTVGRIGYTHMRATGYVISAAGASRFLAHAQRFAHAFDKELHSYWRNGLDLYGLQDAVVRQNDGGHSYIDEDRHEDAPSLRAAYPNAYSIYWRFYRAVARIDDSIRKRAAFATWRRSANSHGRFVDSPADPVH